MTQRMQAGVFVEPGTFEVQERPIPRIMHDDEVLIQVEGCGLCGSDLQILAVPPGHPATPGVIMGHEFIGEIREVGKNVKQFRVGDRVAVDPNLKCGLCRQCRTGLGNHCDNWTTLGIFLDGGFAPYALAPERALHSLSKAVPFADAVWTEVLACVSASTDRLAVLPGQTAVVIGAGPIGMIHGLLMKASGARVVIGDLSEQRLNLAATLGLDVVVNTAKEALLSVVQNLTDGQGAQVVVDAVGSQMKTALQVAARRARVSLFGYDSQARVSFEQNIIMRRELTIFGTYAGFQTFPRAIEILEQKAIQPSKLISHILPVGRMAEGIAAARSGKAMKVVITPNDGAVPPREPAK